MICAICLFLFSESNVRADNPFYWEGELSNNKGYAKISMETDTISVEANIYGDSFKNNSYRITLDAYKKGSSTPQKLGTKKVLKNYYHTYKFTGAKPGTSYSRLKLIVYDENGDVYARLTTSPLQTYKKYKVMSLSEAKKALRKASRDFQSTEVVIRSRYRGNFVTDADVLEEYARNPKYCKNSVIYKITNKEALGTRFLLKKIGIITMNGKNYYVLQMNNNIKKSRKTIATYNKAKSIQRKLKSKLSGKSKQEKVYIFMDYLARKTRYQDNYHNLNTSSAYCCLKYGRAICGGYADALAYLCTLEDIFCIPVYSDGHAWNYVEIGGKFYACDPTFADPILLSGTNKKADRDYWMRGLNDKKFYAKRNHHMTSDLRKELRKYYPLARKSLKASGKRR